MKMVRYRFETNHPRIRNAVNLSWTAILKICLHCKDVCFEEGILELALYKSDLQKHDPGVILFS